MLLKRYKTQLNKIELKFENKIYKVELPDLEGFTGQLALVFHTKAGILMEASVSKKGSIIIGNSYSEKLSTEKPALQETKEEI